MLLMGWRDWRDLMCPVRRIEREQLFFFLVTPFPFISITLSITSSCGINCWGIHEQISNICDEESERLCVCECGIRIDGEETL